jgi:putative transposase
MRFRRYYVPGAAVFISQVVQDRRPMFQAPRMVHLLRSTLEAVREYHPFDLLAYVFLPDHFHLLLQPTGESNFSQIMHSVKTNFTKTYKRLVHQNEPLRFWQKRFWDHVIRDERDLQRHLHYIHYNPIKHGLVADPCDWAQSNYLEWQERGLYPASFAWNEPQHVNWGE